MHLTNTLFICATLVAATVAQSPTTTTTTTTTSLHFTSIPTSLVAGVKQTIGWAGGNGNGVNIILQQGLSDNLQDVPIAPIASGVEGNSTTWIPPKTLPDAGNYALRIEQGEDTVNYSGMLQLFGGCSTCPTDAVAALASASSTASATASSPTSTASSSSTSGVVSSSNSTAASGNSTTTGSSTNSTMGTGSMANMTMSGTNSTTNSTLSSTKSHATSSKSSSSSSSSTSSSTSSSSSGSTSTGTGSSTSPSTTKKSSGVTVAASNFALVLCAVVGVIYLG